MPAIIRSVILALLLSLPFTWVSAQTLVPKDASRELSVDLVAPATCQGISLLYRLTSPAGTGLRVSGRLNATAFWADSMPSKGDVQANGTLGWQQGIRKGKFGLYAGGDLGITYLYAFQFATDTYIRYTASRAVGSYQFVGIFRHTGGVLMRPFAGVSYPVCKWLSVGAEAGLPVTATWTWQFTRTETRQPGGAGQQTRRSTAFQPAEPLPMLNINPNNIVSCWLNFRLG